MSVVDYAKEFENLAVYSRPAVYAPDEEWKINLFLVGLKAEIFSSVSQEEFTTYAELLRLCFIEEDNLSRVPTEGDLKRMSQNHRGRSSQQFRPRPQVFKGKQVQNSRPSSPPVCGNCGKKHFQRCKLGSVECYRCQEKGHFAKDCPQRENLMQGKNTGRAFTWDATTVSGNNVFFCKCIFCEGISLFLYCWLWGNTLVGVDVICRAT